MDHSDRLAVASARRQKVRFEHPWGFFLGSAAVVVGFALQIPMYYNARHMHFVMRGMPPDKAMLLGMGLMAAGLVAAAWGLLPPFSELIRREPSRLEVQALDDAKITSAHVGILVVMAVAVAIDFMKPITLSFVAPGVATEYGLRSAQHPHALPVALLPLSGIGGTVLGSLLWGWLGDRVGRRPTILFAGLIFIASSSCGAMPEYVWNIVMCAIMGIAAGGMLPIAYALLAEILPTRHRSWLMVLVGGDITVAYILVSQLARWLEPYYSWRILWLVGAPFGLVLIMLNRFIPESPRFLTATGRTAEAAIVMRRFGVKVVPAASRQPPIGNPAPTGAKTKELFLPHLLGRTSAVVFFGLAYGLVNYGFILWLPTNLRHIGLGIGASNRLLSDSAIIGLPATVLVALLYGFWSTKKTMIGSAALTAAALAGFAVLGRNAGHHELLLETLIVMLLWGSSGSIAVLTPYSAEIYPTLIRSTGTGLAAGASKLGGFLGLGVAVLSFSPPGIVESAVLGGIPTVMAVAGVSTLAFETRSRSLEEVTRTRIAVTVPGGTK